MTQVRVLTLWQPWASLVIAGAKPFEFRGKRPPSTIIGERVIIHSARRAIDRGEVMVMLDIIKRGGDTWKAELCLHVDKALPVLEEAAKMTVNCSLPFGCGLGTAIVGDPRDGIEIARTEFGAETVDVGDLDSNWGWPLTEIRAWPEPIAAKGKQGIWFWPHDDVPEGVLIDVV